MAHGHVHARTQNPETRMDYTEDQLPPNTDGWAGGKHRKRSVLPFLGRVTVNSCVTVIYILRHQSQAWNYHNNGIDEIIIYSNDFE